MWYGQAERGLLPGRHHFLVWSPLEQIKLQWCASPGDHIGTRNLYCIYTQRLAWRNRACLLSGDIMWSHTDLWSWITRFINLRVFLWNHSQNWCTFLLNENRSQGNVNLLTACVPYSWWDWEILVLSAVTELQDGISELRALKEDVLVPRLVSQATSDCTLEQMLFPGEVVALFWIWSFHWSVCPAGCFAGIKQTWSTELSGDVAVFEWKKSSCVSPCVGYSMGATTIL